MKLTIFFDPPFYVGVLEVERDGQLYAVRHVFGAEPSNQQVYAFVLSELDDLLDHLTRGVAVVPQRQKRINPKRMQRAIRRELAQRGVSSKAHDAMRKQIEAGKRARQEITRAEREAHRDHKRRVKRDKARKRHRGR